MSDADKRVSDESVWRELCRRFEATGIDLLKGRAAGDPLARAEGLQHLARVLATSLQWEIEGGDPDFPVFIPMDTTGAALCGPNPDNTYLWARVAPGRAYRIHGDLGGLYDINLSVFGGVRPDGGVHKTGDVGREQLEIATDGHFEVVISEDERSGNWIRLPERADHVWLRCYYADWRRHRPGCFRIERIGCEGEAPPRLDPETLLARFERLADFFHHQASFAARLMDLGRLEPNRPTEPKAIGLGSAHIVYAQCRFRIQPHEALVLEFDEPVARHWSAHWYTYPWMNNPDLTHRTTSATAHDLDVDPDGKVRIVVAHRDPGVRNWLDVADHVEGILWLHTVWPQKAAAAEGRLVELAEVARALHPGTPRFTPEQRKEQIRERRRHLAWRWGRH
jgi:hypothetical protein